jgi:hypothetical protein
MLFITTCRRPKWTFAKEERFLFKKRAEADIVFAVDCLVDYSIRVSEMLTGYFRCFEVRKMSVPPVRAFNE